MQSKHIGTAVCANRTCNRRFERMTPKGGQPRQYCSRDCQLAARNPTHRKTLQVDIPMDAWHAMMAEARAERVPFAEIVRWALDQYLML